MNTEETKRQIEIMQAFVEGKQIQVNLKHGTTRWKDCEPEPNWNWYDFDYRIKPEEEKPRLMTHKELNEWAGKCKGIIRTDLYTYTSWTYPNELENEPANSIEGNVRIRPWGSDDWIEPTVDIYERDCRR